jgi:hypothetical protein
MDGVAHYYGKILTFDQAEQILSFINAKHYIEE